MPRAAAWLTSLRSDLLTMGWALPGNISARPAASASSYASGDSESSMMTCAPRAPTPEESMCSSTTWHPDGKSHASMPPSL